MSSTASVPLEVPRCRDLARLAPKFRLAVARVVHAMHGRGHNAIVYETIRTDERQRYLHGFGRAYDDGRGIVTNSVTAHTTWHGFGLAVDVIDAVRQWDAPAGFWTALGECARSEQLAWGGDWPSFPDRPHVQWGPPMRRSPSPRAAQLLAAGGLELVWREVRAL